MSSEAGHNEPDAARPFARRRRWRASSSVDLDRTQRCSCAACLTRC
jgi:hypothetical protein